MWIFGERHRPERAGVGARIRLPPGWAGRRVLVVDDQGPSPHAFERLARKQGRTAIITIPPESLGRSVLVLAASESEAEAAR